jgi:hypothetical protein
VTGLYACASHLLVDLPLFGGPVLFVVAAVVLISRNERRRAAAAEDADPRAWAGGEDPVAAGGRG